MRGRRRGVERGGRGRRGKAKGFGKKGFPFAFFLLLFLLVKRLEDGNTIAPLTEHASC